jgi:hypothetical protein
MPDQQIHTRLRRRLLPAPRWWIRAGFAVVLLILPAISTRPWKERLMFAIGVVLVFGTANESYIRGQDLLTRWRVGFMPLSAKSRTMKFVDVIQTKWIDPEKLCTLTQ